MGAASINAVINATNQTHQPPEDSQKGNRQTPHLPPSRCGTIVFQLRKGIFCIDPCLVCVYQCFTMQARHHFLQWNVISQIFDMVPSRKLEVVGHMSWKFSMCAFEIGVSHHYVRGCCIFI